MMMMNVIKLSKKASQRGGDDTKCRRKRESLEAQGPTLCFFALMT